MPKALPRLAVFAATLATLFFGFAQLSLAQQQQPPAGANTLHVTTQLVVLDVVVTDHHGNLVTRPLTRDDFTIIDGNTPQTIRNFETPDQHQMPSPGSAIVNSAADLPKIGDAPVTILVLDELNNRFEDMSYARQMLEKYLKSQPAILPTPTVLMVAQTTTFQQLHDYTQDRDALLLALHKHMPQIPYKAEARSGATGVERLAQVLGALQQITEASTGTPGRKNLIWVGSGFPSADLVGLDDETVKKLEDAIRRVTSRLLAARVTMYTINPTMTATATLDVEEPSDLDTASDENGGDPFGSGGISFSALGPSTGGIAFTGRNDLNNLIGSGIDQGRNYYTLAYTPTDKTVGPTGFRTIKVVMKDRNLVATTRDGYYPAAAADLNPVLDKTMDAKQIRANLQLDLSAALTTTVSYNGLAITAAKSGNGEYAIHVAEKGMEWSDPDNTGNSGAEATVAAGWYDSKGKLLGHIAREEQSPRGTGEGADYKLPIMLPANTVRLRIVVRDARNGHMGTLDLTKF
jgi:VWFA-related protein